MRISKTIGRTTEQLGPVIGRAADRWGRRWLIPAGLGIAALAGVALIFHAPVLLAALMVTVLSLGYDMTQPLLAGIVTTLDRERGGRTGDGTPCVCPVYWIRAGQPAFGGLLGLGFSRALLFFCAAQLLAALAAIPLYRSEKSPNIKTQQLAAAGIVCKSGT